MGMEKGQTDLKGYHNRLQKALKEKGIVGPNVAHLHFLSLS